MTSVVGTAGFHPSRAIGFTGTQHRWAPEQRGRLSSTLLAAYVAGATWMNNGDCLGSDARAAQNWVLLGGKIRLYPPDIDRKRAFLFANESMMPKPYLERNRDIVRDCAALIATPKEDFEEQRSGTWATIRYARKLKRPIIIIWPTLPPTAENWPGSWSSLFSDRDTHPKDGDGLPGSAWEWPGPKASPETQYPPQGGTGSTMPNRAGEGG